LLYTQMGQFRNVLGHYNPNLPLEVAVRKLPKQHGIEMKARKNRWYAWRQMPNGYYFGVGGTPNTDDEWLYDGNEKPKAHPSKGAKGWVNTSKGQKSVEWEYNDEPPTQVVFSD
jgi:hypothetical protein